MKKSPVFQLFLILVLSFVAMPSRAETGHYLVTTDDGLSNSSVNCFYQDDRGVLWLGTWDGLNVYDGGRIRVFRSDPRNEHSLLDGIVLDIEKEDESHLWAVTDWGVNRLDLDTETFTRFRLGSTQINSFSGGGVCLTVTRQGRVFCSSRGWGIAFYDSKAGKMVPFNVLGCNTSEITALESAGDDRLVITTVDGSAVAVTYSFDADRGEIDAALSEVLIPETCGIYRMASSRDRILFVGSDKAYEYDKTSCALSDSIAFRGNVSYAEMFPDGTWGLVTDRSRMYQIDFGADTLSCLETLSRDNMLCFHCGTQGIIWLAIDGKGIEAYSTASDPMRKLSSSSVSGDKNAGAVSSMVQTEDGDIYVSVLGAGLSLLDSDCNLIRRSVGGEKYVFSMAKGPSGRIFLGVRDGVKSLDTATGRISQLYNFDENLSVISYCMHYDEKANCLWVGTLNQGVIGLELGTGRRADTAVSIRRFSHDSADPASLSSDNVMSIAAAGADSLWISTLGGGLNLLDVRTGRVTHQDLGEDLKNIPANNVRFALQDSRSTLWVGTSYGLCRGIRNDDGEWSFSLFDISSGLSDNTVQSLVKDKKGRIWISTNNGLSMLDPESGHISNYTSTGSLQGKEFYINSFLRAADGRIFFGGVGGINFFYPDDLQPRNFTPEIIIGRLSISADNFRLIRDGHPLKLEHNENFFTVSFSAVEYVNNSNCEYAYKLEGFNEDWTTVSSGTQATFTNVPPGHYVFRVRSTNGDKIWCDNEQSFALTVRKPFYLMWWAFLSYFAIVALTVWSLLRFLRERHRQRQLLDDEVKAKQAQKETYEAKLTFFTNIAHEFGTPLTLISCSGERLSETLGKNVRADHYVKIINDNATRMQKLIQELLEFRKVDTGRYDLKYSAVDPLAMLNSILDDFAEVGQTHSIVLDFKSDALPERFICDVSALEKIFINLVSNAYKYTPDGGTVSVGISGKDGGISVDVANTSKGLSEEKLGRVFDRFVIFDNFERRMAKGKPVRNGVGMALVKSLVSALDGEISVSSVVGESVTFSLYLPSASEDRIVPSEQQPSGSETVRTELPVIPPVEDPVVEEPAERKQRGNLPLVLVVDDEQQIRDMVADILGTDCDVVSAADGQEALELLGREKIDIVITDINMPRMDGTELLRRMKQDELTRFIPVVILAMRTDVTDEINSYNLGSDAFIPKPFLPAQLTAVVNGILRKRSGLRDYYTSSASDVEMLYGVKMNSSDRKFISSIISLVESKISEDLSPSDVAAHLCVSEMTLYRKVKNVMDKTPGELIRQIKLKHAANLLKTTSLTVQEIMFDSGFNNKSWFYRKFSEMYGMSPKEYRESD